MVVARGLVLMTAFAVGPGLGGLGGLEGEVGVVAMFSVLAGFHPLSLFINLFPSIKSVSKVEIVVVWL